MDIELWFGFLPHSERLERGYRNGDRFLKPNSRSLKKRSTPQPHGSLDSLSSSSAALPSSRSSAMSRWDGRIQLFDSDWVEAPNVSSTSLLLIPTSGTQSFIPPTPPNQSFNCLLSHRQGLVNPISIPLSFSLIFLRHLTTDFSNIIYREHQQNHEPCYSQPHHPSSLFPVVSFSLPTPPCGSICHFTAFLSSGLQSPHYINFWNGSPKHVFSKRIIFMKTVHVPHSHMFSLAYRYPIIFSFLTEAWYLSSSTKDWMGSCIFVALQMTHLFDSGDNCPLIMSDLSSSYWRWSCCEWNGIRVKSFTRPNHKAN